ncbi:MAG: hypothetical protein WC556_12790 [Candidatus Methanoperedens sp.]
MKLKIIEGAKPSRELTDEDKPHYDKNFVYIPIWFVSDLAEKHHVSKKSAFWQILNHEILHIKLGHRLYEGPYPRCGRDFQMWANSYRRTQLAAMPKPIDEEVIILNNDMKQIIEDVIKEFHDRFKKSKSLQQQKN